MIEWALRHRKTHARRSPRRRFVGAFMLFPLIGGGFMPDSDNSEFVVPFETPEGSSLAYTRQKAEQIDAALRRLAGRGRTRTRPSAPVPTGTVTGGDIYVKLMPPGERERVAAAS